jgi:hypothetical protein
MTPLLTVTDAVAVLADIGAPLSARQIRYLGLEPAQRWPGQNGGRLFDPVDTTLLAIFAEVVSKCRAWELPVWSARAVLLYREAELRRAVTRRSPRFLLVDPARGTAVLSETADASQYVIDVRALAGRVSSAVQAFRSAHPSIWTGAERVPLTGAMTH